MTFWSIAATIYGAGCFGGLMNAFLAGELHLPKLDRRARLWRPGWIGNVLIGGVAAVIFWGLYGPIAGTEITGASSPRFVLRAAELFGAVLTGIGGGRLLSAEIDRRVQRSEKAALTEVKDLLANALKTVTSRERNL